jgi:hypothetical protein
MARCSRCSCRAYEHDVGNDDGQDVAAELETIITSRRRLLFYNRPDTSALLRLNCVVRLVALKRLGLHGEHTTDPPSTERILDGCKAARDDTENGGSLWFFPIFSNFTVRCSQSARAGLHQHIGGNRTSGRRPHCIVRRIITPWGACLHRCRVTVVVNQQFNCFYST